MTRRNFRRALVLTLVGVQLLTACSDDTPKDDDGKTTKTTTVGTGDISTKPSAEWGELARCPIEPPVTPAGTTPATEGIDGVLDFGKLAQDHVEGCVDYPMHPAVGGPHFQVWANCGFYSSPVPEELAVHSLEHGAVWIAFDPAIDADQLADIAGATGSGFVIASPYPGLTRSIVLSAWSRQLTLDSTSDPRFAKFVDTYVQGHQTPEPGAPCVGGLGTPR